MIVELRHGWPEIYLRSFASFFGLGPEGAFRCSGVRGLGCPKTIRALEPSSPPLLEVWGSSWRPRGRVREGGLGLQRREGLDVPEP